MFLSYVPVAPVLTKPRMAAQSFVVQTTPFCGPSASLLVSVETFQRVASADALRAYRRRWPDCRWQVESFLSRPPPALMAFALALDIIAPNLTSRPMQRSPLSLLSSARPGPVRSPMPRPSWQKLPSSRQLRLNTCAPQRSRTPRSRPPDVGSTPLICRSLFPACRGR